MKYFVVILCFLIMVISCKKENIAQTIPNQNSELSPKTDSSFVARLKKVRLSSDAKKVVEEWPEYQNIDEFIIKYYNNTTKEALFNSQRLAELTQQLKDSIRIEKFDEPSFRTRLNILHNEALRLADMDSIPNITAQEVIKENKNIVNAFEAVKLKINSIVNKNRLEDDLKEFDHLFNKDSLEEENVNEKNKVTGNKQKKSIKRINPPPKQKKDDENL